MPFYDAWTQSQFLAEFGRAMAVISTNTVNPAIIRMRFRFFRDLIGNFTNAIMSYVRASYATCRFEVLYPVDVNHTTFNQAINFPAAAWTPAILKVLKTEGFGFTLAGIWTKAKPRSTRRTGFRRRSGVTWWGSAISTTPWLKEAQ